MKLATIGKISTVILVVFIIVLAWLKEDGLEYEVKGRIAGFSADPYTVLVEHEEIKGYMSAMTMPFTVLDSIELADLEIGQAIRFKYYVKLEDGSSYIDSIELIDDSLVAKSGEIAFDLGLNVSNSSNFVQVGDKLPEYELIDQSGRTLNTKDLVGKKLLITFIYTNCPVPDYCPLMSLNFKEVYSELIKKESNFVMLSISFDYQRDTPEVLKAYGEKYVSDFEFWKFVSGTQSTIEKITSDFSVITQTEQNQIIHNLRTVYIDESGRVKKIWPDNLWNASDILRYIAP